MIGRYTIWLPGAVEYTGILPSSSTSMDTEHLSDWKPNIGTGTGDNLDLLLLSPWYDGSLMGTEKKDGCPSILAILAQSSPQKKKLIVLDVKGST